MTTTLNQKYTTNNSLIANPEIELLLCCSRTKLTPKIQKQIRALVEQEIDWQYLMQLAAQHGLMPLLFNSLNTTCPTAVPTEILAGLRSVFQRVARRNLFLTAELLKILKIFRDNEIDAIPFKGPTLTASAYGNMALRQFCDLDVLIRKEHCEKATQILVDLGFNLPDKIAQAENRPYFQNSYFLESTEYQGSYDLYHPKNGVQFEMHWSLTTKAFPFPPTFQYFWENNEPVRLAGQEVPRFTKETLLIYLCVHASKPKHTWSELKWICDLAELIQSYPDLDWDKVNKQAKIWGCDRAVFLGLSLAQDLLGVQLPKNIISEIAKDQTVAALKAQVKEYIFDKPLKETEEYIFQFKIRSNFCDRISYLINLLFTPTTNEWEYIQLPKSLSFLYYFVRPYRLMREFLHNKNRK
ncbi:MAG: hypothetical protein Tsb0014_00060 [Pleurocapsa sp.]